VIFAPGTGWLYRLSAITKLIAMLWMISATIVLPPTATMVLVAAGVLIAYTGGAGNAVLTKGLVTMAPLIVGLVIVHGFIIAQPDDVRFGPLHVSAAGLMYAYGVLARIAGVLTASLLFVTTTHPGDMLKSLDAHGVSPEIGFLIASPLLLIEPFTRRAQSIRDAQRARGVDLTGSWRARIGALTALLVPLITLVLSDLDHRANVLDGRGFRAEPRRTVLDAQPDDAGQRWFRRIAGTLAVLQLSLPLLWR
jgi:energy-coupling factor transport system permease protein